MKNKGSISRREFLKMASFAAGATILAACAPATATTAVQQANPTQPAASQPTAPAATAMPEATLTQPAAVPTASAGGKVTINVATGAVGQELQMAQAGAQRYMTAHPDTTVTILSTPDMVQDRLAVYRQFFEAKSTDVDLYQIDTIWPGDLASNFLDLNQYGAKDHLGVMFPSMVQNDNVDGKQVAIPWFTDAGLLFYRTDLLTKNGYTDPPKTWDDLKTMAQKIQDGERSGGNQDFWGFVWQGNAYEGLTCDGLEWIYSYNGGTIVTPDKKITINNPQAAAAIDNAATWVGSISPTGVTGFAEEDARNLWQAGNAAFMRNWPYAYSLGEAADSKVAGKLDVAPLPAITGGKPAAALGGWQLSVSAYSKNPQVAADVAFYFTSAEEQKVRAIQGSFQPTVMSLYQDADVLKAVPFFGKLYDVFINAVPRPSTATAPNYNQVSTYFFNSVHDVLMGTKDGKTAVAEIEADLVDLLKYPTATP
jgi:trehalose/maltose transport system substrate-binding protein